MAPAVRAIVRQDAVRTRSRTRAKAPEASPAFALSPQVSRAIRLAFFLSGAAALCYQVVWLRLLSTFFGNTTLALSVCLTAFMSGLALGSYLFGRWGDRWARPFRAYAALELVIGVYGLGSPLLIAAVRLAYLALAHRLPLDSFWLVSFQFSACFIVLLIPTAVMGGTLPIVVRAVVRRFDAIGREVAWLYGLNTFGAAAGALFAGFFLLPLIGLRSTVGLAAAINLLVGLIAWRLDLRAAASPRVEPAAEPRSATASAVAPVAVTPVQMALMVVGFGLSGFAGLAMEVVWGRAICTLMGSSVYAFSAVLFGVLVGIALGSVLAARLLRDQRVGPGWFAAVQLGAGLATLALVAVYRVLPGTFQNLVLRYSGNYSLLLSLDVLVILAFLLVPMLCSGASFPVLARVVVRDDQRVSRRIGVLYAANTVGCILGSLASGFVLIPRIGLHASAVLCGALYAATGAAVLLAGRGRERAAGVAALVATAVVVTALPSWRYDLMQAGLFDRETAAMDLASKAPFGTLEFYREGTLCTVSVVKHGKTRILRVNGKADASTTTADHITQSMSAHLPLLLADRTDNVLVVGLGCGATAGAATLHPAKRVDCVEIEPAVADAAHYFTDINHNVFANPRFHLIFGDGRNYLAATDRQYDVITCEPSNPWVAGVASLFTVEHFQACRDRLADDGTICQWLSVYYMSPEDFASIISSFVKVFPDATLWAADRAPADLMLVAKKHPWKVNYPVLRARMSSSVEIQADLKLATIDSPLVMLSSLLRGPADLARLSQWWKAIGPLNTDDLPVLEFSAPKGLYRPSSGPDNFALLNNFTGQAFDEIVNYGPPRDAATREGLADALTSRLWVPVQVAPRTPWPRAELTAALAGTADPARVHEKLAKVALGEGDIAAARLHARKSLELDPKRTEAKRILAGIGG